MTPTGNPNLKLSWRRQQVRLRFQIGEFTLFSRELTLPVADPSLAQLLACPLREEGEDGRIDGVQGGPLGLAAEAGGEGWMVRSLPMRGPMRGPMTGPMAGPMAGPMTGTGPRLARRTGMLYYRLARFERHYIELTGSFEDYLGRFSAKSRNGLRRKARRFAAHSGGEIHWRRYRTPEEMARFFPLARRVSALTYQERLLDVGLPGDAAFEREMTRLAAADAVRGFLLFAGERPIAYLYTPLRDGALLYRYLGYDPEFRRWSPGAVLLYLVLESLFAENDRTARWFDFTEGEGSHKRQFATGSLDCGNLLCLPDSLANRLTLAGHAALEGFSYAVVAQLDRLGLKQRLKRYFRERSGGGKSGTVD